MLTANRRNPSRRTPTRSTELSHRNSRSKPELSGTSDSPGGYRGLRGYASERDVELRLSCSCTASLRRRSTGTFSSTSVLRSQLTRHPGAWDSGKTKLQDAWYAWPGGRVRGRRARPSPTDSSSPTLHRHVQLTSFDLSVLPLTRSPVSLHHQESRELSYHWVPQWLRCRRTGPPLSTLRRCPTNQLHQRSAGMTRSKWVSLPPLSDEQIGGARHLFRRCRLGRSSVETHRRCGPRSYLFSQPTLRRHLQTRATTPAHKLMRDLRTVRLKIGHPQIMSHHRRRSIGVLSGT
jgi:hypothetical protein